MAPRSLTVAARLRHGSLTVAALRAGQQSNGPFGLTPRGGFDRSQIDDVSFFSADHREGGARARNRGVEKAVKVIIRVRRLVVERDKLFDARQCREGDRMLHPAVTPSHAGLIFLRAVLRVVNEQIGVRCQGVTGGPLGGEREARDAQRRLVVGQVGENSMGTGDSVTDRGTGVADEVARDVELADPERLTRDFMEDGRSGQIPELRGKERR
jgi:hypothetical protein